MPDDHRDRVDRFDVGHPLDGDAPLDPHEARPMTSCPSCGSLLFAGACLSHRIRVPR